MKRINIYLSTLILITIAISGCSSTSGVIKIGLDTYTIATSASFGKGGIPAAKRIAYEEAGEQCQKLGNLEVYTLSEKSNGSSFDKPKTYSCHDLQNPAYTQSLSISKSKAVFDTWNYKTYCRNFGNKVSYGMEQIDCDNQTKMQGGYMVLDFDEIVGRAVRSIRVGDQTTDIQSFVYQCTKVAKQ